MVIKMKGDDHGYVDKREVLVWMMLLVFKILV